MKEFFFILHASALVLGIWAVTSLSHCYCKKGLGEWG